MHVRFLQHQFFYLGCRTIPNLEDVALTFDHLGIHLQELQDYVQQVEASPAPKPLGPIPVKTEQNLMDFSGEDHLPAPIKIMPKVETEPVATEIKEGAIVEYSLIAMVVFCLFIFPAARWYLNVGKYWKHV